MPNINQIRNLVQEMVSKFPTDKIKGLQNNRLNNIIEQLKLLQTDKALSSPLNKINENLSLAQREALLNRSHEIIEKLNPNYNFAKHEPLRLIGNANQVNMKSGYDAIHSNTYNNLAQNAVLYKLKNMFT